MKNSIVLLIIIVFLSLIGCKKYDCQDYPNCTLNWADSSDKHINNSNFGKLLDEIERQGFPSVAIAVLDSLNGIWIGARGYACIEESDQLDKCAMHHSASLSKSYIACVIILLHQQNKLNVNNKVKEYLKDHIKGVENYEECTVLNLLNHTSGIYDFNENPNLYTDAINNPYNVREWRDHIEKYVCGRKAYFKVGNGVRYSNTNYLLLGLVIESITQMELGNALKSLLFEPYGLKETSYFDQSYANQLPVVNSYYERLPDILQNCTKIQQHFASISKGHEGIIASAGDYVKYFHLLNSGKILNSSNLDLMRDFLPSAETGVLYGCGIMQFTTPIGIVYGHTGNAFGSMTFMYYVPHKKRTVFLATNVGGVFNEKLKSTLFNEIRNKILLEINY